MTQANILEMAKLGNAQAIATLLNRQLQPKGISAKAQLNNGCLEIMLEASQVPSQDAVISFIKRGMDNLQIESIDKVIIYGRETGQNKPAWKDEFHLKEPTTLGDFIIPSAIPESGNRNSENFEEIEENNSDNYSYSSEPEEYDISMISEEEFIPENSQLGKKSNPLSGIINGIVAAPLILKIGVFAVIAAGGGLLLWKMQQSDNVADVPVIVKPVSNKITPKTPDKPAETPKAQTPDKPAETPKAQTPDKPAETPKAQTPDKPKETPKAQTPDKPKETPKTQTSEKPAETPKAQTSEKPAETPKTQTSEKPKETPKTQTSEKPAETPKTQTSDKPAETPKTQTSDKPKETPKAQTVPNPKSTPNAIPANKAVINPKSTSKPNQTSTPEGNPPELGNVGKPAIGINVLQQGVNEAEKTGLLSTVAKTKDQWNNVASSWQKSINLMGQVPKNHPKYSLAQSKIQEYRKNMNYAKNQANQTKN